MDNKNVITRIAIICLLVFVANISYGADAPSALSKLKASRKKLEAKQKADLEKQTKIVKDGYFKMIKAIKTDAKQKGDIDTVMVLLKEEKRFAASQDVTEKDLAKEPDILVKAQQLYLTMIDKKKNNALRVQHKNLIGYSNALKRLQKSLTKKGEIDAAMEVMAAGKAADFEIAAMDVSSALQDEKPPEKVASASKPKPVKKPELTSTKDRIDLAKLIGTWTIHYPTAKGRMMIHADGTVNWAEAVGAWKMESDHVLLKRSNGKTFIIPRPISKGSSKYGPYTMSKD